jgi:aminoglycoside/choline kinase family phosphotransferase
VADRVHVIGGFLERSGFAAAVRLPLAGDASARRYERLIGGPAPAVLMDAPPERLDVRPFLAVQAVLRDLGLSAPALLAAAPEHGLLLLEDLGDASFGRVLAGGSDEVLLYTAAVDLLVELQAAAPAAGLPAYDDARFQLELGLLPEWYLPALDPAAVRQYRVLWSALLPESRVGRACFVYVDYHADNLIWLPQRSGSAAVGLLDFQDARVGPAAYDLVSLLEDARRDVPAPLAERMIGHYLRQRPELDPQAFRAAYAILGAQRHSKILGLFTRLARRDGKPHYLSLLPRVRAHLRRDLEHPALAPLRPWYEAHLHL